MRVLRAKREMWCLSHESTCLHHFRNLLSSLQGDQVKVMRALRYQPFLGLNSFQLPPHGRRQQRTATRRPTLVCRSFFLRRLPKKKGWKPHGFFRGLYPHFPSTRLHRQTQPDIRAVVVAGGSEIAIGVAPVPTTYIYTTLEIPASSKASKVLLQTSAAK